MPIWENYEVEVETKVTILCSGRAIAEYKTYGEAKAGSNEEVDKSGIPGAVSKSINMAAADASGIAQAIKVNRRKRIGYRDGN
jgi:hypothetical protein